MNDSKGADAIGRQAIFTFTGFHTGGSAVEELVKSKARDSFMQNTSVIENFGSIPAFAKQCRQFL